MQAHRRTNWAGLETVIHSYGSLGRIRLVLLKQQKPVKLADGDTILSNYLAS